MMAKPCHYCGEVVSGRRLHNAQIIPPSRGGSRNRSNKVWCCDGCNSTKGARTFEEARGALIRRMLGWPKFSDAQIEFLRARGFDLTEHDNARLYFERLLDAA